MSDSSPHWVLRAIQTVLCSAHCIFSFHPSSFSPTEPQAPHPANIASTDHITWLPCPWLPDAGPKKAQGVEGKADWLFILFSPTPTPSPASRELTAAQAGQAQMGSPSCSLSCPQVPGAPPALPSGCRVSNPSPLLLAQRCCTVPLGSPEPVHTCCSYLRNVLP